MNNINYNTHSFSPQLAKLYGFQSAVLLQHLYHWLKHNKGKNKNFHDGNWWTYNTRKGFAEYFEYLSEDQIRGAISKLKSRGIIITGNYNKIPYDKTTWYSLTKEGWQLFNDTIGENPQSNGECTQSSGGNPQSKDDKSPTYTNSKTISKQSSSYKDEKEEVKDLKENNKKPTFEEIEQAIKDHFILKGYKSSVEQFLLYYKKNISDTFQKLDYKAFKWEEKFKDVNPTTEKTSVVVESKLSDDQEKALKFMNAKIDYCKKHLKNPKSLTKEEIEWIKNNN